MAKRFTDTSKWAKGSFAELSIKLKLVWIYLCDNCDHAGVWDVNIPLMTFQLGAKVTLEEILTGFGDKVELRGKKVYIPSFADFQYGNLNPANRVHKSILDRVQKLAPSKPLTSPFQGSMEMDMELEMDMDMEKEEALKFNFDVLYAKYPRKLGKAEGIRRLEKVIRTKEDYDAFSTAIDRYRGYCAAQQTEASFIKHFTSFIGTAESQPWRDWLDPVTGTADKPEAIKRDYSFLKEGA